MLSEPKYKHNLLDGNGTWLSGSNDWEIVTLTQKALRDKNRELGIRQSLRIITFHP